jgi:hypothetical protein
MLGGFSDLSHKGDLMAYSKTNSKGVTYYLHGRTQTLKSGKQTTLYFFSKSVQAGALDSVPAGYVVSETKNGLPVLKKA